MTSGVHTSGMARAVRCALVGVTLASAAGASCHRPIRNPFAGFNAPQAPEVLADGATVDQIIAAVNSNAAKITSYQTTNATITVPGSPGVPSLSGKIAVERPGRIRLEASTALTGKEVDLGSNDQLFWIWVRRSEPPAMYFSRHNQYAGSQAQQFLPVEPTWLLDALGLVQFAPTDAHEAATPRDKQTVEIKSIVQSATGQLTKRTVIDARRALVLEQHVYDQAGTLLASAITREHRYHLEIGASLPQQVDIQVPPAGLALSVDVGAVAINAPMDNPGVWTMPTIPGAPLVDLGAASPAMAGGGAPKLGDQINDADWYGPAPGMVAGADGQQFSSPAAAPSQLAAGTPQFVAPMGQPIAATLPSAGTTPEVAGTQRLPSGGIAAPEILMR